MFPWLQICSQPTVYSKISCDVGGSFLSSNPWSEEAALKKNDDDDNDEVRRGSKKGRRDIILCSQRQGTLILNASHMKCRTWLFNLLKWNMEPGFWARGTAWLFWEPPCFSVIIKKAATHTANRLFGPMLLAYWKWLGSDIDVTK